MRSYISLYNIELIIDESRRIHSDIPSSLYFMGIVRPPPCRK